MEKPRYLGTSEFVEELAEHLADAPLRPHYRSGKDLRRDVARQVADFTHSRLEPLGVPFDVWQEGASPPDDLDPVAVFGRDFRPDVAIQVAEVPTVAVIVQLISGREADEHLALASVLGRALICSRVYPAILAFALDQGPAEEHKHWWDREVRGELWARYQIKLVIRR